MSGLPPPPTEWIFDALRDPPAYTRPLIGSELSMQRHWDNFDAPPSGCHSDSDGEVCVGIDFTSPLKTTELKFRAREALDKLRFLCPIIACTVEDIRSPRWIYTPSADRDAWLDLALAVEERGTSLNASQFVQSINLRRLPYISRDGTTTLFRTYLLVTSDEGGRESRNCGLYFHGSHTIIDAGPALHALNLMCEWISGEGRDVRIEPSEEWKNLPVDPITVTGGPCKEWETDGARFTQEIGELSARTSRRHTLAPPFRPLNLADPPFRYTFSLSESETASVAAEAKKLGFSVSTLFHAAHCLAQVKMNPPDVGTEIDFSSEWTVVSLERYMKPPVDAKTHLISSFTMMPLRFSMSQALTEPTEKRRLIMTTKLLQERFNRYLDNPCLPHLTAAMTMMPPTETHNHSTADSEGETPTAPWSCAFNNLGIIEKRLRTKHGEAIAVENLRMGNRLRHHMTVHMWTMHSKFVFQIQGNMAWGEDCIKSVLDETVRIGLLILDKS